MGLNLYDLLDVDETADAAEIRAAWKSAIADLDPGDRRFRAYNDAAGVLLDADKRAAYDEQLADERAAETDDEPDAAEDEPAPVAPTEASVETPPETQAETEPDALSDPEPAPDADGEPVDVRPAPTTTPRTGPPVWSLALAGIGAALAVAAAAWAIHAPDVKPRAEQAATIADTDRTAEQFVADKIVPAMSYDYRTLDSDLKNLQQYMTPAMAAKQANLWKALTPEAKKDRIVVSQGVVTDAPATGLTRASADGKRALVVAFIRQDFKQLASPSRTLNVWASFSLVKDKTGQWQLADVCTERDCS
ncbi:hypothetical protein [Nocardioides montaniterrae]